MEAGIRWTKIGINNLSPLYVRDLWKHETTGPHKEGISVPVPPHDVVMLRLSKSKEFPLPSIISSDTYLVSLRSIDRNPQILSATLTFRNLGTAELPLWSISSNLPAWLSVQVTRKGKNQVVINRVFTSGLKKGSYHALVRLDNKEPISGKPLSAFYYDIDLEVTDYVAERPKPPQGKDLLL